MSLRSVLSSLRRNNTLIVKGKNYVKAGTSPPKGVQLHRGKRGGYYYFVEDKHLTNAGKEHELIRSRGVRRDQWNEIEQKYISQGAEAVHFVPVPGLEKDKNGNPLYNIYVRWKDTDQKLADKKRINQEKRNQSLSSPASGKQTTSVKTFDGETYQVTPEDLAMKDRMGMNEEGWKAYLERKKQASSGSPAPENPKAVPTGAEPPKPPVNSPGDATAEPDEKDPDEKHWVEKNGVHAYPTVDYKEGKLTRNGHYEIHPSGQFGAKLYHVDKNGKKSKLAIAYDKVFGTKSETDINTEKSRAKNVTALKGQIKSLNPNLRSFLASEMERHDRDRAEKPKKEPKISKNPLFELQQFLHGIRTGKIDPQLQQEQDSFTHEQGEQNPKDYLKQKLKELRPDASDEDIEAATQRAVIKHTRAVKDGRQAPMADAVRAGRNHLDLLKDHHRQAPVTGDQVRKELFGDLPMVKLETGQTSAPVRNAESSALLRFLDMKGYEGSVTPAGKNDAGKAVFSVTWQKKGATAPEKELDEDPYQDWTTRTFPSEKAAIQQMRAHQAAGYEIKDFESIYPGPGKEKHTFQVRKKPAVPDEDSKKASDEMEAIEWVERHAERMRKQADKRRAFKGKPYNPVLNYKPDAPAETPKPEPSPVKPVSFKKDSDFTTRQTAEKTVSALQKQGYPAEVRERSVGKTTVFSVYRGKKGDSPPSSPETPPVKNNTHTLNTDPMKKRAWLSRIHSYEPHKPVNDQYGRTFIQPTRTEGGKHQYENLKDGLYEHRASDEVNTGHFLIENGQKREIQPDEYETRLKQMPTMYDKLEQVKSSNPAKPEEPQKMIPIGGTTYPHRDYIKSIPGRRYDKDTKSWLIPEPRTDEEREKIKTELTGRGLYLPGDEPKPAEQKYKGSGDVVTELNSQYPKTEGWSSTSFQNRFNAKDKIKALKDQGYEVEDHHVSNYGGSNWGRTFLFYRKPVRTAASAATA